MLQDVHLVEQAKRYIRDEQDRGRVGGAPGARPDPGGVRRIEDPYFRERRSDIAMVGERLLRNLLGMVESSAEDTPKGSIAVAHDLSPADAAQLGRAEAAGFCTEGGGRTSHTAIVARALGLPLVVGVERLGHRVWSGMTVIVDGNRGEVILDPDAEALRRYRARADVQRARAQRLSAMRDAPAATIDGARDPPGGQRRDAGGDPDRRRSRRRVGRASFAPSSCTSSGATLPTEEEQYAHAVAALKSVGGRPITFRTLDLGRRQAARRRCACRAAPTRRWGCARSATRSTASTSSARSCARSTARRSRGRCGSCSR